MSQLNLQIFCKPKDQFMGKPWTFDGWTYATNGIICVRIPSGETNTREDFRVASTLFTKFPDSDWKPWPAANFGTVISECWICLNEKKRDIEVETCPICRGFNFVICPSAQSVENWKINAVLHHMISKLPNPEFSSVRVRADDECPLFFRFEGGQGAVMPMKQIGELIDLIELALAAKPGTVFVGHK